MFSFQGYCRVLFATLVTICLNHKMLVQSLSEIDVMNIEKSENNLKLNKSDVIDRTTNRLDIFTNDPTTIALNRTSRQFYQFSPGLMKNSRGPNPMSMHSPMHTPMHSMNSRNARFPFQQQQAAARPRILNSPPAHPPQQVLRRIHSGLPPGAIRIIHHRPNNFYSPQEMMNTRFSPPENGGPNPFALNAREMSMSGRSYQRNQGPPQYAVYHPNSIHHHQQDSQKMGIHFKASPTFNGKVVVRPVHQYPIPMSAKEQAHMESQAIYHQNPSMQKNKIYYNHQQQQQQKQQQQQLQQQHGERYPPTSENTYSVHEEPNEDRDPNTRSQQQQLTSNSQQTALKEADNYLKFMGTNEYFLPKRSPEYQNINSAKFPKQMATTRIYKWVTANPLSSQSAHSHSLIHSSKPMRTANHAHSVTTIAPFESASTASYSHSLMDDNFFVVNSDGKRKVNHFVPGPLHESKHQITAASTPKTEAHKKIYSHQRNRKEGDAPSAAANTATTKDRSSGPERFEFTERDAIHSAYTSNPIKVISKKNSNIDDSKNVGTSVNVVQREIYGGGSTATSTTVVYGNVKPVHENIYTDGEGDADMENEDDMQRKTAESDIFSQNNLINSSTTEPTNNEQKYIEEYCGRFCSKVKGNDGKVLCGSDGFMYVSEEQMDCYSECLDIDIFIQNMGKCT